MEVQSVTVWWGSTERQGSRWAHQGFPKVHGRCLFEQLRCKMGQCNSCRCVIYTCTTITSVFPFCLLIHFACFGRTWWTLLTLEDWKKSCVSQWSSFMQHILNNRTNEKNETESAIKKGGGKRTQKAKSCQLRCMWACRSDGTDRTAQRDDYKKRA